MLLLLLLLLRGFGAYGSCLWCCAAGRARVQRGGVVSKAGGLPASDHRVPPYVYAFALHGREELCSSAAANVEDT